MSAITLNELPPEPSPYRLPTLADNLRALLFAVLIHVAAFLMMFVGVWFSAEAPQIDAGEPIEVEMIGMPAMKPPAAAPAPPKPVPPKPAQPKPQPPKPAPVPPVAKPEPAPPKPEPAARQDDVTDQRPVAPPKPEVDPLAPTPEELRRQQREEQARRQLEDIRRQRDEAEAARRKEQENLDKIRAQQQADLARERAAAKAEEDALRQAQIAEEAAAIRGSVQTDDLLAQWQSLVRQTIYSHARLPANAPTRYHCRIRISAIIGGEVVGRNVIEPCDMPEDIQQYFLDAIDTASPLPYSGFEEVFQRSFTITFTPDAAR